MGIGGGEREMVLHIYYIIICFFYYFSKNIGEDTERFRQLMLNQLVQQLQGSLVLPVCLRLVGLLRRMNVFNETELRLKFLQVRT